MVEQRTDNVHSVSLTLFYVCIHHYFVFGDTPIIDQSLKIQKQPLLDQKYHLF